MIWFLLYYALATILLAAVDAIRIRMVLPHKKANIRKWVSWSLAIATGAGCWQLSGNPGLLAAAVIAFGARWALFDPALNVFRGFPIDYESDRTNSRIDQKEQLIGLSFWAQRLIGAVMAGLPFLINWIKSI